MRGTAHQGKGHEGHHTPAPHTGEPEPVPRRPKPPWLVYQPINLHWNVLAVYQSNASSGNGDRLGGSSNYRGLEGEDEGSLLY